MESSGRYTKYVGTLTGLFIPAGTRILALGEITDGKFTDGVSSASLARTVLKPSTHYFVIEPPNNPAFCYMNAPIYEGKQLEGNTGIYFY